jgi:hypothetical protein
MFSGMATSACSLALQTGETPEKALEVLERGRAVILSLLIDDQCDISELRAAYSNLCETYQSLRSEVNTPVDSTTNQLDREAALKRRSKAIKELGMCIQEIRRLPGLGQFQKGLTVEQMQKCAAKGCMVFVNVTDLRSDAIAVSANGFIAIPLPDLGASQAKSWLDQDLTAASSNDRGAKNKAYLQFLSWLWRERVKPVLDERQYPAQSSVDSLHRIWWIGTGLANSFPFHAADEIATGSIENTYRRAVSSYTPSIKLLHIPENGHLPELHRAVASQSCSLLL